MKQVRRTVDELNELAEKMTGVNPKAKTDAQALNFIEQSYGSNRASIYVYNFYENEKGINEIDLTLKQLREIYNAVDGKVLLFANDGYGMFTWFDNIDIESGTILSSINNTTLYSTSDDEKFNEGE